jgi:hypothetical protein
MPLNTEAGATVERFRIHMITEAVRTARVPRVPVVVVPVVVVPVVVLQDPTPASNLVHLSTFGLETAPPVHPVCPLGMSANLS